MLSLQHFTGSFRLLQAFAWSFVGRLAWSRGRVPGSAASGLLGKVRRPSLCPGTLSTLSVEHKEGPNRKESQALWM